MIEKENIIKILDSWNLWNRKLNTGIRREHYLKKILPLIERKEVIVIKGIRRSGKSTIMKQLMQELIKQRVEKEQLLYVNLEDYGFRNSLNLNLFDLILESYKENITPKGKVYFFIDEIQLIPEWERYIRTKYDLEENIKFIVSGSNASLLSKELGTKLTGRNLTIKVNPLSYEEYKSFVDKPELSKFMKFGGFPEVVLEKDETRKKIILQQYFEDIINKEILARHNIRNTEAIFNLATDLIQNSGCKQSMNKISKNLGIDDKTVSEYISYLMDSYLIIKVPFFSFSVKKRFNKATQPKYYASDNGFLQITSLQFSKDKGKVFENMCLLEANISKEKIAYWQEDGEVDFVFGNKAVNVTTANTKIPKREFDGLLNFKSKHKKFELFLLTSKKPEETHETIKVKHFEEFFKE